MDDGPRHDDAVVLTAPRSLLGALAVREAAAPAPGGEPRSLVHTLVRPDDQVRLRFELVNGRVDPATNTIVALTKPEGIFYVISLGPQHTVEDPIASGTTPPTAAVAHRTAAESRIAVSIPPGTPFTVATLLDLAAFRLRLDARAAGGAAKGDLQEPSADVTALEVPASLVLSPVAGERFVAETLPITHGAVTELWRARLARMSGGRPVEPPSAQPVVRAIWSRPDDPGFDRPVDADDRADLVTQTTTGVAEPIILRQCWLTSQGAFLDADGAWANGVLAAYQHRVVSGRDLHVEVVERGYLAPFGHPASITTLVERVFLDDEDGTTTASLTSDEFLAVGAAPLEFPAPFMPHEGRTLPFTHLTATDPGTGPIGSRPVTMPNGSSITSAKAKVVTRAGEDLRISYVATDQGGHGGIAFDLPVVFVSESEAYEPDAQVGGVRTVLDKLQRWYADNANVAFAEADLGGQSVAWAAPPDDARRGGAGSVQPTNRIRFRLDRPDIVADEPDDIEDELRDVGRPAIFPGVERAWVVDVTSTTAFGGQPPETEVTVAARYLELGTSEANLDLGYLDLVAGVELTPTTDATGMISTSLQVDTFGQRLGAGINLPGDGTWNPADALAGVPELLGNLSLTDLIGSIDTSDLFSNTGLPTMEVEPIPGAGPFDPPVGVCVHFTWEPQLKSFPADAESKTFVVTGDFEAQGLTDVFDGAATHALLALRTCTPGDTSFEALLERFAIQVPPAIKALKIAPVVVIMFDHVRFTNVNGASAVDTEIADWSFINSLGWLEPIKDFLLDTLGLGAPTFDGGIFIDFDIPIPGLTLGVVGVHGLEVGLDLDLPDNGSSAVGFSMCSREDPFVITIMGIGGTGSFGLELDAARIVLIEGSLAITYELAVNVFVVAAAVSVELGVFVEYDGDEVVLGAYATVRGSISVIGLVEISGSVTVALIYNVTSKVLRGVAEVTGEVSSPFGKSSVTRDVEVEVALGEDGKQIAAIAPPAPGGPADPPSFRDRYSRPEWTEYCAAFAAA